MSRGASDYSGREFGRLRAVRLLGKDRYGENVWECTCVCPARTRVLARAKDLSARRKTSCGCLSAEHKARVRSRHRPVVEEMWSQGYSCGQIAARVGVSRQRVHKMIQEYRKGEEAKRT